MACSAVTLPGGIRAIICSSRKRQRCACGNWAVLLCDWTGPAKGRTCDAPICTRCAMSPAPGKDLCKAHARAFDEWRASRRVATPVQGVML